jgi:DNA mismatch repair protein MutL
MGPSPDNQIDKPKATAKRPVIRLLPPHIINRIAAGEVVERPASVVKELVENALDAGATRIDIVASAGGRNIRIADNGMGMTPEDAKLAFVNHATSKVWDEADLDHIETLGFRGEALASISAISRLTCLTKTKEAATGSKISLNERQEPIVSETGCATGTVMEIQDLFYNTPARLKFLKRPQTELGHIEETVQNLALSHPDVQFSLMLNDQQQVKTSGSGKLLTGIHEVLKLSQQDTQQLIALTQEDLTAKISLAGYVSSPSHPKSSKRWLITFVNNRLVRCPILAKAIETAYQALIPHGKYPIAVLFLSMPVDEVDVNVHPTKREVRYASGQEVFAFVQHSVRQTLEQNGHVAFFGMDLATGSSEHPTSSGLSQNPNTGFYAASSRPNGPASVFPSRMPAMHWPTQPRLEFTTSPSVESKNTLNTSSPESSNKTDFGPEGFRVIGQLFNTYILLETPQGLMVVDQHIASERYYFEKLTRSTMDTPDAQVQQQLGVNPIGISPTQHDLLAQASPLFNQLGFDFVLDSKASTVILQAVPILYQDRQPEDLFESLLKQLEETGQMALELDHLISTLACHTAVRAGDVLSQHDMSLVISQWLSCKLPWTCPHGRPIAHTIQTSQLNGFFERPSLPVNAI